VGWIASLGEARDREAVRSGKMGASGALGLCDHSRPNDHAAQVWIPYFVGCLGLGVALGIFSYLGHSNGLVGDDVPDRALAESPSTPG
jgi:hypothetical protein